MSHDPPLYPGFGFVDVITRKEPRRAICSGYGVFLAVNPVQVPVQTARTPYARTGPFSVMFTPFPSCDLHTRRPLSTASVAPLLLLWPALALSLSFACANDTTFSHHLRVPH